MAATPLLLIPGLNCTAALYAAQVATLGARRAVMVVDHTSADSLAAIADRVLADAPPRFAVAGLSMGGYVAMELLRRAPERVDRLALIDTQARADTAESAEARRQQIAIAEKGGFPRIVELQIPRFLTPAHADDPALAGLVRAMAEATGPDAFVRQQKAILGRIDSRPSLARVACPTVVIVGAEDVVTPLELAREMSDAVPGARLEVIAGAGHLSPIEAPEAVSAVLAAWLSA